MKNILPDGTIDLRSATFDKKQSLVFDFNSKEAELYYVKSDNKKFVQILSGKPVSLKKGNYRFAFVIKEKTKFTPITYRVRND